MKRNQVEPLSEQSLPKKSKYSMEIDVQACLDMMNKDKLLAAALSKFKEISTHEIDKMIKEQGLDHQVAISNLLEKIRSGNLPFHPTPEELQLVIQMTGFNSVDARRTLLMKDELVKLRQHGCEGPAAIEELIARMKSLSGTKRPFSSLSQAESSGATTSEEDAEWQGRNKRARCIDSASSQTSGIQNPSQATLYSSIQHPSFNSQSFSPSAPSLSSPFSLNSSHSLHSSGSHQQTASKKRKTPPGLQQDSTHSESPPSSPSYSPTSPTYLPTSPPYMGSADPESSSFDETSEPKAPYSLDNTTQTFKKLKRHGSHP